MQPRSGGTPTFIEEQDKGSGSNYESPDSGTGDGFQPRNSSEEDKTPDPLDNQTFGTSAGGRDELRFKIPARIINRENPEAQKCPAHRAKQQEGLEFHLVNLDEKITSRTLPQRTRLVERRNWQPMIADNVSRRSPAINLGWVPVPAPAQVAQK